MRPISPPVPAGCDPLCSVVVFQVHPQPPGRRGTPGQRGIEASREAVRCWVIKVGPLIAANLRRRRCGPADLTCQHPRLRIEFSQSQRRNVALQPTPDVPS